jgi:hypothetical protein
MADGGAQPPAKKPRRVFNRLVAVYISEEEAIAAMARMGLTLDTKNAK